MFHNIIHCTIIITAAIIYTNVTIKYNVIVLIISKYLTNFFKCLIYSYELRFDFIVWSLC